MNRTSPPGHPTAVRTVQLSLLKTKMKDAGGRGGPPTVRRPRKDRPPAATPGAGEAEVQAIVLVPCLCCGRRFAQDRIQQHARICKAPRKMRKVFDPSEHRTRGTEFAAFAKAPAPAAKSTSAAEAKPRSTWKQKSAALRGAMLSARGQPGGCRAASGAEALPSDETNRTPCPHCRRRFSDKAAERHIPICTSIVNQPKMLQRGAGRKAHQRAGLTK